MSTGMVMITSLCQAKVVCILCIQHSMLQISVATALDDLDT